MTRRSIKVVVTAVLLVATIADGVAAQQPPTYGGGRLESAALPKHYVPTVGIALQPRGDRIAMRFDSTVRCGREAIDVVGRGNVRFDGTTFSLRGGSVQRLRKGRLAFEWTVTGQIGGGSASGTIHVVGARRGSGRTRACTAKPDRPFQARLAGPPAGSPALAQPRGLYVGTSSYEIVDHLQAPVVLRASKDARKVTARWTIAAKCGRRPRESFVNLTPPSRVRSGGAFARRERFSVRYADALVRYRTSFAGRFAADGATGTLRLRARIFNRRGTSLRTRCDSGTRHWNAARVSEGGPGTPAPAAPGPTTPPPPTPGEPSQPVPGAWSLTMTSDPGDYIGGGRAWSHGPATDTIRVWGERSLVRLYLTNAEGWWDGNFAAPPGQQLRAGATYAGARRYPFNDNAPGLEVGGYGRGCNELTGSFTVDELNFDPNGALRAFKVRFEQHCENATPALHGTWTFHAA